MGTAAISPFQGFQNPLFRQLIEAQLSAPGVSKPATTSDTPPPAAPEDVLQLGQSGQSGQASLVETSFYSSRTESFSLLAQMQQAAAAGQEGAPDSTQQMDFAFVAEMHTEQLFRFQQQTATVAEGLDGTRRISYAELSQQVAARFDMSISLSGSALNGFAKASDGLKDSEKLFDKLIDLSQKLLEKAQAFFDQFMSQFDGMLDTSNPKDFADKFQKMVDQFLQQMGNLGGPPGQVKKAGAAQEVSIQIQMEFSFSFEGRIEIQGQQVQESDPIMLDLDGDGFELTNYADGAKFDITGSGQVVKTAFVKGGDAFLALDRNRDGIINNGKELFGDQYGSANGYEELRKLDGNGDNRIDRNDQAFADLLLFRDNGNGQTDKNELLSLSAAGIESISLQYLDVNQQAAGGNRIAQTASYRTHSGRTGNASDAVLNYLA